MSEPANKPTKFTFGFSPCPNDTFIFDALYHKKIDTKEYEFEFIIEDVEELNKLALSGKVDITKLSFATYARCSKDYILSDSGSALGKGCGPLLISADKGLVNPDANMKVGIPGWNTTANFLLTIAYPQLTNKVEMLFSDIESALIEGSIDLGLIIHENRFTYQNKGLHLIKDLGEYWESSTQQSIPLGGIAISKSLPIHVQKDIQTMIRRSLEYAINNPSDSRKWISSHAQEMEFNIMKEHIALYVNEYSMSLGREGRKSVEFLLEKAEKLKIIKKNYPPFFID